MPYWRSAPLCATERPPFWLYRLKGKLPAVASIYLYQILNFSWDWSERHIFVRDQVYNLLDRLIGWIGLM
jgi:hypothetical protein